MAAVRLLVDTDILIDYFNAGHHSRLLDDPRNRIYYSIKEALRRFRLIPLGPAIAGRYSTLRRQHPNLEREDALIAATAMVKRFPLMTRNWKHFRRIAGLTLYAGA